MVLSSTSQGSSSQNPILPPSVLPLHTTIRINNGNDEIRPTTTTTTAPARPQASGSSRGSLYQQATTTTPAIPIDIENNGQAAEGAAVPPLPEQQPQPQRQQQEYDNTGLEALYQLSREDNRHNAPNRSIPIKYAVLGVIATPAISMLTLVAFTNKIANSTLSGFIPPVLAGGATIGLSAVAGFTHYAINSIRHNTRVREGVLQYQQNPQAFVDRIQDDPPQQQDDRNAQGRVAYDIIANTDATLVQHNIRYAMLETMHATTVQEVRQEIHQLSQNTSLANIDKGRLKKNA